MDQHLIEPREVKMYFWKCSCGWCGEPHDLKDLKFLEECEVCYNPYLICSNDYFEVPS